MENLTTYFLVIWIFWIFWVSFAVYYKWTRQKNLFFHILYAVLVLAFGTLAFTIESPENTALHPAFLSVPASLILQHLVILILLTIFLQKCVWWFTHRWHRNN